MQILSSNDGNELDNKTIIVLHTISEPGETLSRGPWCYPFAKILENNCSCMFYGWFDNSCMGDCFFLFHEYSQMKTDIWVYLEYLFESIILEIAFPQQRVIDVKQ